MTTTPPNTTNSPHFAPARVVIIGHRGTGKSAFLARVRKAFDSDSPPDLLDLDKYIEAQTGKTIPQIFAEQGEAEFRKLESLYFLKITAQTASLPQSVFLSAGAGFVPPERGPWQFWWLRRSTDSQGRLFLNRPRLDAKVSPMSEFKDRFHERESLYSQWADEILTLQEGFDFDNFAEKLWIRNELTNVQGAVTLTPTVLASDDRAHQFFQRRKGWGIQFFELRDDLLDPDMINRALGLAPHKNILLSFRDPGNKSALLKIQNDLNLGFDWPLEWGPCPIGKPTVLSYHRRETSLEETFKIVGSLVEKSTSLAVPTKPILKLALPIHSFKELQLGHRWQQEDPISRSFLPMSEDGRWRWYRILMRDRMPLQFWREGLGSAPDQPTLLEWVRQSEFKPNPPHTNNPKFAAVLGDPIEHSRTPAEHYEFFRELRHPVLGVRVTREDWADSALGILNDLGLNWAAVTSPLKDLAFQGSITEDPLTQELQTSNTLIWNNEKSVWQGINTDLAGLKFALEKNIPDYPKLNFAIWGGGGTLAMAKNLLPSSTISFSARTGHPKSPIVYPGSPDVVLWAVGRKTFEMAPVLPLASWQPRWVLDLNYSEDSPGLEYAAKFRLNYVGGLDMFKGQAKAQREYWKKF